MDRPETIDEIIKSMSNVDELKGKEVGWLARDLSNALERDRAEHKEALRQAYVVIKALNEQLALLRAEP